MRPCKSASINTVCLLSDVESFLVDNTSSMRHHWSTPQDIPDQPIAVRVAAICSLYRDGAEILRKIKAKDQARKVLSALSTQELELSLHRGEEVVQSQYDRDYKRFGTVFTNGDGQWLSTRFEKHPANYVHSDSERRFDEH